MRSRLHWKRGQERLHPLCPRHLFQHRATASLPPGAGGGADLLICASLAPLTQAVVPYRSADDYGHPGRRCSIAPIAGARWPRPSMATSRARISSPAATAVFRYVVRKDLREVLFICDASNGEIRRQIDMGGSLGSFPDSEIAHDAGQSAGLTARCAIPIAS
jgi:hypothetical protein